MTQKLTISPVLLLVAVLCQLGMGLICGYLMYDATHRPKAWSLDSTTYYKFLEGQGKLNLKVYQQQQAHEERLRTLDKKRTARHRHIDSLSGPALQQEIDRQYNGQPAKAGPQTNSTDRNGGTSGPERQSRSDHAVRGSGKSGYPVKSTETSLVKPGADDSTTQRTPAAGDQRSRQSANGFSRDVPEVARSTVGKLDRTGGSGGVHRGQTQTHLRYWQRIRAQGYTYPDIAWAISAVETGYWWTRPPGDNLFGFKKNSRHLYASVSAGGYCRYRNEADSFADYGAYERGVIAKYKLHSRVDYLRHIHRRYCPNPAYPGKLVLAFRELNRIRSLT
jgi:hypothetical protein